MKTARKRMPFAPALTVLVWAAGCTPSQQIGADTATEVEREICLQWRDSLPTRSRSDTERTQQEIGYAYDVRFP